MSQRKLYIGDSVYVEFDGESLILTTENGLGATNRIVLESAVFLALVQFWRLHTKAELS